MLFSIQVGNADPSAACIEMGCAGNRNINTVGDANLIVSVIEI